MYNLEDRVAIVTGAGRKGGIGAAVALRLARDGAHVVVGDICAPPSELPHAGSGQWEELAAIAEEIESLGVRGLPLRVDVTDAD
ncbi:MAG: NAD(P)H-hydrate epimerase, partial [Anaerolineae bacterium]